jgi:14-3-3 protein epsilon
MALTPDPANLSRDQALYMAKIAEQAERYEDMVKYMKRIVTMGTKGDELSVEERNLISVGYKNMMSVRRTAWRTIQGMEGHDPDLDSLTEAYKQSVTEEVFALIEEVGKEIVEPYVEGPMAATTTEVLVFFHKMAGDYNRYGAEITKDDIREKYRKEATKSYKGATQSATAGLQTTNPIRLGLALNFSVFHYEICDEKEEATRLAKDAFDQAIDQLDNLPDDEYKDSTLIMQLLKDNLTLWNDNAEDEQDIQVEDVA